MFELDPPFEPHRLLPGAHLQTLAGVYLPGGSFAHESQQHRVRLPDGDQVVLHDDSPSDWKAGGRVTLLMHGLAGSHRSGYMLRIAQKLVARGVRTFRMDLRNCGAGFGLARLPYHSGRSEDAAAAIGEIAKICPRSPLTLVGFSLSGNITLKLLGELDGQACGHLDSAMAVCPPIDLAGCCRRLKRWLNRLYDRHFVYHLMRQLRELAAKIDDPPTAPSRRPRGIWEFDDIYTAPVCGFGTAENYYKQASSGPLVGRIKLPTLILASRDDPLVRVDDFERLKLPSTVKMHLTRRGGHLGFISRGSDDPDRRWMDWRLVDWVTSR
jgi:predicted alpha/beta-fold hydrolase